MALIIRFSLEAAGIVVDNKSGSAITSDKPIALVGEFICRKKIPFY